MNKITLLHQVGFSNYFMRKMHGQTTLRYLPEYCSFHTSLESKDNDVHARGLSGTNSRLFRERTFMRHAFDRSWQSFLNADCTKST